MGRLEVKGVSGGQGGKKLEGGHPCLRLGPPKHSTHCRS